MTTTTTTPTTAPLSGPELVARDSSGEFAVRAGSYLSEVLVTDTRVYEVVKVTAKTARLRRTKDGDAHRDMMVDQGPYPVMWIDQMPNPSAEEFTVRLTKDGRLRVRGGNPLYPTGTGPSGLPARRVDYRY